MTLRIIRYILRKNNIGIILYGHNQKRMDTLTQIYRVQKETEMLCSIQEAYQICSLVQRTDKISGDIAEVGVYKGATAKLICINKGNRALHLFDTFEGMPKVSGLDSGINHVFIEGMAKTSYFEVRKYLNSFDNVYFYKGLFPDTARPISDKLFSFVHLDVDLYQSTKDCLEFFYPRMSIGGLLLVHDYNYVTGVSKAVDEFFQNKPEPIIELPDSQCMIQRSDKDMNSTKWRNINELKYAKISEVPPITKSHFIHNDCFCPECKKQTLKREDIIISSLKYPFFSTDILLAVFVICKNCGYIYQVPGSEKLGIYHQDQSEIPTHMTNNQVFNLLGLSFIALTFVVVILVYYGIINTNT